MKPRILLVDDQQNNLNALLGNLKSRHGDNWDYFLANNEDAAMTVLEQQLKDQTPIDVVLTDLIMNNERSGMDLLKRALQLDEHLMVILVTAKEHSLNREEAFQSKAFDVVDKNMLKGKAINEIISRTEIACRCRSWQRDKVQLERDKVRLERERVSDRNRYLDPHVIAMLDHAPNLLDLREEKPITICFWDIRGFTALCVKLDRHVHLIKDFMNDYCQQAVEAIHNNGGILDKFIGDGVMALFGVPCHNKIWNDAGADSAVRAAMELRRHFLEARRRLAEKVKLDVAGTIDITIRLGCGINTEPALVGRVNTNSRDQFTALGKSVNLAARLEGTAKEGQIYITGPTKARLRDALIPVSPEKLITGLKGDESEYRVHEVEPAFVW